MKEIRKELGVTRYRMAKLLGITQTSYDRLENSNKSIKYTHLIELRRMSKLSWKKFGEILEKESIKRK